MRIINIIETINNVVQSIESFGVFEEQLVDDVVKDAEKLFMKKAIENGAREEDDDIHLDNGYYESGDYIVTIVWSEIIWM